MCRIHQTQKESTVHYTAPGSQTRVGDGKEREEVSLRLSDHGLVAGRNAKGLHGHLKLVPTGFQPLIHLVENQTKKMRWERPLR